MAAATVRVPPITANTPVKNPDKVFVRSSRLITFIGDMSYLLMLVSIEFLLECGYEDAITYVAYKNAWNTTTED